MGLGQSGAQASKYLKCVENVLEFAPFNQVGDWVLYVGMGGIWTELLAELIGVSSLNVTLSKICGNL